MDLPYLRAHPEQLPVLLAHQRIRETPVGGGDICTATRLTLDDGTSLFLKTWPERAGRPLPEGFFATEAAGLAWLREAGAVPVPEVIASLPTMLALEWVEPGPATPQAAERFGRELAALHRAGAPAFGAEWPGFIGSLPQDNTPSTDPWPTWFAERRLLPYLRRSPPATADGRATDDARIDRPRCGRPLPPGCRWPPGVLRGPPSAGRGAGMAAPASGPPGDGRHAAGTARREPYRG